MDWDKDADFERTRELFRLLRAPRWDDETWGEAFDSIFLDSLFAYDHQQPYMRGPDGFHCFAFMEPRGTVAVTTPRQMLDRMVEYVMGCVVLDGIGETIAVISPGDMVGFKFYGKRRLWWKGGWGELVDQETYSRGGQMNVGSPGVEMMPPLAARSLEWYMRYFMHGYPELTMEPSVLLVRPGSRTRPDEASDLTLNVCLEDLGGDSERMGRFLDAAGHFLPRHLAIRLMSFPADFVRSSPELTPLRRIIESGGLSSAILSFDA